MLTPQKIEQSYAIISKYYNQYLKENKVKLPRLKNGNQYTKDAIVLICLFQGYPKTRVWTKEELTHIIRDLIDPKVNDVQQARHLGHQKGWYILSGTRRDNEAIDAGLRPGDYWLKTLEEPYPGYNASRRTVTEDFDELKAAYEYRCACCGSKEGEKNFRNPSKITRLQMGHMDPSKELSPGNIIPQCDECNRADRDWWVFDANGRVVGIGSETVIDRCSDEIKRRIYERLKKQYEKN